MEKTFELARKFRLCLAVLTIAIFALMATSKVHAFWPPDLIPHGPEIPDHPIPKNPHDDGTL